jgi:hypothetical protein
MVGKLEIRYFALRGQKVVRLKRASGEHYFQSPPLWRWDSFDGVRVETWFHKQDAGERGTLPAKPQLFETMVWWPIHKSKRQWGRRTRRFKYYTYDEAKRGHMEACEMVRLTPKSSLRDVVVRAIGYPAGRSCPFVGMWLHLVNLDAHGGQGFGFDWTPDKEQALRFVSVNEAKNFWRGLSLEPPPLGGDGKPNRQLTSISVTFDTMDP